MQSNITPEGVAQSSPLISNATGSGGVQLVTYPLRCHNFGMRNFFDLAVWIIGRLAIGS
jgi:hypothetical protein